MRAPRQRDPIVPAANGSTGDRTGTAGIRRRASAQIRKRFDGLQREVLAVFDRIRVYSINDAAVGRSVYALTPDELAAVSQALREALDRWIASGREAAHSFWWSPFDAEASQLGAAQASTNLAAIAPAYAAARSLEQIIYSQPYRDRVGVAQVKSYEHWTGLAAESRATLSQIIGRAVVDGKAPRAVRAEIAEALDASKSKALSYAQTDITDTLRQARAAEADAAQEQFGLALGILWTSALKPTTRPWHASRHGKVYSTGEVREFYTQRGNRYNCYCGLTEALLDTDGNPILTDTLKKAMAKEKAAWQKTQAG
jgi:uncharacterized protein with gpF-like domain